MGSKLRLGGVWQGRSDALGCLWRQLPASGSPGSHNWGSVASRLGRDSVSPTFLIFLACASSGSGSCTALRKQP